MPAISGQTTVTTAGTEVPLGSAQINSAIHIKALDTNTGKIYVGNNGSGVVGSTTGLVLLAGESCIFEFLGNLSSVMIDASVSGEGVAWLVLDA